MTKARKLYVKSFGCQMNVYDSRRMADTLAPHGYVETGTAENADLVILNSNPVDDIAHASDIDTVIKNGAVYPAKEILTR